MDASIVQERSSIVYTLSFFELTRLLMEDLYTIRRSSSPQSRVSSWPVSIRTVIGVGVEGSSARPLDACKHYRVSISSIARYINILYTERDSSYLTLLYFKGCSTNSIALQLLLCIHIYLFISFFLFWGWGEGEIVNIIFNRGRSMEILFSLCIHIKRDYSFSFFLQLISFFFILSFSAFVI